MELSSTTALARFSRGPGSVPAYERREGGWMFIGTLGEIGAQLQGHGDTDTQTNVDREGAHRGMSTQAHHGHWHMGAYDHGSRVKLL